MVTRTKSGRKLYEKGGRPRLLDCESLEAVREQLRENPDITDEDLKLVIRHEYNNSCKRKLNIDVEDTYDEYGDQTLQFKINRQSARLYVLHFRHNIFF